MWCPVSIKDFTPTKGQLTTQGSMAYKDHYGTCDAVIVQRLKAAGAIVVAKTTTPEFAYSSFTQSRLWGVTRNPWNPALTPGGSSGGAAVSVVTSAVPLAEGSDMGGSVRIPAAFSGCVGMKPSKGRIPMEVTETVFDHISHFGPLARTVEDVALFLRVTEGPDERDIQSQLNPLPVPESLHSVVRGLRIAASPDLGFYEVDAGIVRNLEKASQRSGTPVPQSTGSTSIGPRAMPPTGSTTGACFLPRNTGTCWTMAATCWTPTWS